MAGEKNLAYYESSDSKQDVADKNEANAGIESDSDQDGLTSMGYETTMKRNRSMLTLLFQSLAITAVPFGEGSALISAIYGGGPMTIFVGWIVVALLSQCISISIGEIASRYPTSAGPYYWSFRLASSHRVFLSFVTGWVWLIGNWLITLSVNFGFASLLAATVAIYHPDWEPTTWQLLLIFYGLTLLTFTVCSLGNRFLPIVDTICAAWTAMSILVILITLSATAKEGRHSASYALGGYDKSLSGWGGFSFFIGLLPPAYTFSAVGMIASMAEETPNPAVKVPRAVALCIPVAGTAGLFLVLPICFTLPPLSLLINAPDGQALPTLFYHVTGTQGGGLGLMFLVFGVTIFCSVSITCAASRTTWAFARDNGIPLSRLWSKLDKRSGAPIWAYFLITVVQMLLGLLNIGSSSAFTAFVSVGVFSLAVSFGIPISISLYNRRRQVHEARWNWGPIVGTTINIIAVAWIAFELILFSMPTVLPVTLVSMNYAIVVFFGFFTLSIIWYFIYARKVYEGPPESDAVK